MSKARNRTSKAATVGDVARFLDSVAPPNLAQRWDNVGLLAGDPTAPCRHVSLCIDMTAAVVRAAMSVKSDLLLAYHPPIFKPLSRLLAAETKGGTPVWDAARAGIAVYSPHTALDAADGGTNDVLAELAGVTVEGPFEWVSPGAASCKIVTFVPPAEADAVAEALFTAGAGRIGEYTRCSYRIAGTGTFFGGEGARPAVGTRGRYETVDEIRLETVVPQSDVPAVVAALRRAHSYEEPAFDVYPLAGEPTRGIGRVGVLARATRLASLARSLKKKLSLDAVEMIGDGDQHVQRVAVCVGSAGRLPLERAAAAECDVVITGELRHHDALAFQSAGMAAIMLGHWASERPALDALAARIRSAFDQLNVSVSSADQAPTAFI